ncbi:MAG: hypothetical protein SH850_28745 [Planctomycetaceae bacterium]|nr:hypothetical protein [Planctomycetaceae bacterium]
MPQNGDKQPPLKAAAASPAPSVSAAARVDSDLVKRAYQKVMNRADLTRDERDALRRHEKEKEERLRWQFYESIPQKHWRAMTGRQTKVINEQAERYGLPFGGPAINLPKLARALHDFLADNALKLARDADGDSLMQGGGSSPALERYREERAALARLDRLERERGLLPRDEARDALGRIAAILRGAGDALQRQFGTGAVEILYEAIEDAQHEMDRMFGDSHGHTGAATPDAG